MNSQLTFGEAFHKSSPSRCAADAKRLAEINGADLTIKALIERRLELGLTQEDLDQAIGNPDRLCSKWESYVRNPSWASFHYWLQALDCHIKLVPNSTKP